MCLFITYDGHLGLKNLTYNLDVKLPSIITKI